ncbi:hypothetical protein AB0F07_25085 [Streptomyces fructofermentans]|uniref:hypothetical protein n=1 Tax=Streptomyces fructofermentans TaxID=152141 RepID=UPI0033F169D7
MEAESAALAASGATMLVGLIAALAPDASRTFVNLGSGGVNYGPPFQGSHIHGGIVFSRLTIFRDVARRADGRVNSYTVMNHVDELIA